MNRLPSTALIFGTALSMSLASCSTVPASAQSEGEESSSSADLKAIKVSVDGLKTDIQNLSKQVTALDAKISTMSTGSGKAAASPEAETKAKELALQIQKHIEAGEMTEAKKVLASLKAKYPTTSAYRSLERRTVPELAVIGKKVSQSTLSSHIDSWFVDGAVDLDSGVTLIVFWEVWCPHCKREMPELVSLYNSKRDKGLKVLGLTRLTKSSTQEKVEAFVAEHELNYPVAKENGKIAPLFNVSGIPAGAVVKDGEIIWRGHPSKINDALWDKWLN
jgi:thiol-disulfide isomerase/thioredoxin